MPSKTDKPDIFRDSVAKLAQSIEMSDTEKLSQFMRQVIQWIVGNHIPAMQGMTEPEKRIGFRKVADAVIPGFEVEFKAIIRKGRECLINLIFGDERYNGLPDERPQIPKDETKSPLVDKAQLLKEALSSPLVERRRINIKAMRGGKAIEWLTFEKGQNPTIDIEVK